MRKSYCVCKKAKQVLAKFDFVFLLGQNLVLVLWNVNPRILIDLLWARLSELKNASGRIKYLALVGMIHARKEINIYRFTI